MGADFAANEQSAAGSEFGWVGSGVSYNGRVSRIWVFRISYKRKSLTVAVNKQYLLVVRPFRS